MVSSETRSALEHNSTAAFVSWKEIFERQALLHAAARSQTPFYQYPSLWSFASYCALQRGELLSQQEMKIHEVCTQLLGRETRSGLEDNEHSFLLRCTMWSFGSLCTRPPPRGARAQFCCLTPFGRLAACARANATSTRHRRRAADIPLSAAAPNGSEFNSATSLGPRNTREGRSFLFFEIYESVVMWLVH
jgi:hypothetical protein